MSEVSDKMAEMSQVGTNEIEVEGVAEGTNPNAEGSDRKQMEGGDHNQEGTDQKQMDESDQKQEGTDHKKMDGGDHNQEGTDHKKMDGADQKQLEGGDQKQEGTDKKQMDGGDHNQEETDRKKMEGGDQKQEGGNQKKAGAERKKRSHRKKRGSERKKEVVVVIDLKQAGTDRKEQGAEEEAQARKEGRKGLRLGENPFPDQPPLGTISGESYEIFRTTQEKKKIYDCALEMEKVLPLKSPWTFWVDKIDPGMMGQMGYMFETNVQRIFTAFTAHSYLTALETMVPNPSSLPLRSGLFFMRDYRRPVWEEPYNRAGGCFRIRVLKSDTDKLWREMLMCAISEQLSAFVRPEDEVCGVSVSIREAEDVISIWNTQAEPAGRSKIHEFMQLLIPNVRIVAFFYKPHTSHASFDKLFLEPDPFNESI